MTFEWPKLIWVWVDDPTYTHGGWNLDKESKNAPYVRGDLYQTLVEERDELAAELRVYMDAAEAHMVEHMRTIDRAEKAEDGVKRMVVGIDGMKSYYGRRRTGVIARECDRLRAEIARLTAERDQAIALLNEGEQNE